MAELLWLPTKLICKTSSKKSNNQSFIGNLIMLHENIAFYSTFISLSWIEIIVFLLLVAASAFGLYFIFLRMGLLLVKSEKNGFMEVALTVLICVALTFIPFIGVFLCIMVIIQRHKLRIIMALVVWVLAIVMGWVIAILIALTIMEILGTSIMLY